VHLLVLTIEESYYVHGTNAITKIAVYNSQELGTQINSERIS